MAITSTVLSQVLLSLHPPAPAVPLRFGVPLPAARLGAGLRVEGPPGVRMQWRPLQRRPDPRTGRLWIEICLSGAHGRVKIAARGAGPVGPEGGTAVRCEELASTTPERRTALSRWRWHSGEVDTVRRVAFLRRQAFVEPAKQGVAVTEADAAPAGIEFDGGESLTLGYQPSRFARAGISSRLWRRAGILPPGSRVGREFRTHLLKSLARIAELTGLRDVGDYRRGKGVMTNLEFDTALAFARLGLAEGHQGLLERAWRSATHSMDHDLDPHSKLLFAHGSDHRSRPGDPGHTWLAGILLVGCLAADRQLIRAAERIAHGLAEHPPQGQGYQERVRDLGWPLLEMEAWLRFADDAKVEAAVAVLVRRLLSKWNETDRVFEFGEGRRSKGVYYAPLWVTAGSLLPGLRAYAARTGDRSVRKMIQQSERRIADLIRNGKPGLPIRYLLAGGKVLRQTRVSGVPSGFLLLEGLPPAALRRCLERRQVRQALRQVPSDDDVNLITSWTMVGRCWWIQG